MMKFPFKNKKEIDSYSNDYLRRYKGTKYAEDEKKIMQKMVNARKRRFLTKREFVELGVWKTHRQKGNYNKNDENAVKEITRLSFKLHSNDELRIKVLTLLKGVKMRVASAILHLAFCNVPSGYPLLDFRALRSLTGRRYPEPNFEDIDLWSAYVKFCRLQAKKYGVLSMRDLDRALWEYDKKKHG